MVRTAMGSAAPAFLRRLWPAIPVIALALILIPTPGLVFTSGPAHVATPVSAPAAPPSPHAPAAPSGSGSLPGSHPTQPGLTRDQLLPSVLQYANYLNRTNGSGSAASGRSGASTGSGHPGPLVYLPTGTFTGTIANASDPSQGLTGVEVQAYPDQAGHFCTTCFQETSNATGYFQVTCPAGRAYVTYQKSFWTQNLTYATCVVNSTVNLGTLYMIPSGAAVGRLLADVAGHPAIVGATIQGEVRDYSLIAIPTVTTNSTGWFKVPIPPAAADRIDLKSPGGGYQDNFTWTEAGAGQTVSLGTLYLEPNAVVKAKLLDAVTHAQIDGGFATPDSLTVCSSMTGVCDGQGPPTTSGNVVTAGGPVGYDYVIATGIGYIVNVTPVGYVPPSTGAHPYCVPDNCIIFLTPLGTMNVKSTVSGTPSSAFPTGLWYATDCGLNGFQMGIPKFNPSTYTYNTTTTTCTGSNCFSPGSTASLGGFPLRNDIQVQPDTSAYCNGQFPDWPIPGDLPVWSNETWANSTPEMTTNLGWLNLTPGSYIYGHVYIQGTTAAPTNGFTVGVASRIAPTLASFPYATGNSAWSCSAGQNNVGAFCAPAPPGPDKLSVSATGYPGNFTWIAVPWRCCNLQHGALPLANVTEPSVSTINLTILPSVTGSVVVLGGSEPVGFGSVSVCASSPTSPVPCVQGLVARTGNFVVSEIPSGWDTVQLSAGGYDLNSEWFYAPPGNETIALPTIPLTPLAILAGTIYSTNGSALIDSSVYACPIATAVSTGICNTPLGSGVTTTNGFYEGQVFGGPLPSGTYEIEASAPGYVTDWTWVNATANLTTTVPNMYLAPVGATGSVHGAHGLVARPPATASTSTWVDGVVLDNSTGKGVVTQSIMACPTVATTGCVQFQGGSNTGGFFNDSMPAGVYNLTIGATGYFPVTALITVPSNVANYVLPNIDLVQLYWVNGTVFLDPWRTTTVTSGGIHHLPLMVPTGVQACSTAFLCGLSVPSATDGAFQVQAYPGHYDHITATPLYPGTFTSAPGGVVANNSFVNISAPFTNLTVQGDPFLPLFASVSGTVFNAASCTPGLGTPVCTDAAIWANVLVTASGVNNGAATATVTGSGNYTVFIPGGDPPNADSLTATDPSWYYSNATKIPAILGPGENLTYRMQPLELTSFGFATATIVDSVTHLPLPGEGVTAVYSNTASNIFGSSSETANAAGFVNVTAPSGGSVGFSFGGLGNYNTTKLQAPVVPGNTTNLDNYSIGHTAVQLAPWGHVESSYLNYSAPSNYLGTIVDRLLGVPLPYAQVSVSSNDASLGSGSSYPTNELGQFLSDAPIGGHDTVTVVLPGYSTVGLTPVNVTAGAQISYSKIPLTGDAIVASRVLAQPGNLPVAGAGVQVCAGTANNGTLCATTVTNATGYYWIDVPPGHVAVTVTAVGFVSNYTETATVSTDQWIWIPPYSVVQDGTLSGVVRGLPTGLPIPGALVEACSPIGGTPVGPCSYTVTARANGSFSLPVVPSQYVLVASAPDFNTTYLSVSVNAGANVNLGPVFLSEYGILAGTVVNAKTQKPVLNATVSGYPVDPFAPGVTPAATDASGSYRIAAPPGGVLVVVVAKGYVPSNLSARAVSGATATLPVIELTPLENETYYEVSGVTELAGAATPLAGVTVALTVGSTVAAGAVSDANGAFTVTVPTGAYTLRATLPGYGALTLGLAVSETISGLQLQLTPFAWSVTGTVTDGLTHAAVASVAIWSATELVGVTDSHGAFQLALPNGSYTLTAVPGGASAGVYPTVSFQVVVSAAPAARTIELVPSSAIVSGVVTSTQDQSPVGGALVNLAGVAVDGAPVNFNVTTDAQGRFSVAVYLGTYSVTGSRPGFDPATANLTVGVTTPGLNLALVPTAIHSSGASGPSSIMLVTVLGVVLAAAVGIGLLWGRRRGGSA